MTNRAVSIATSAVWCLLLVASCSSETPSQERSADSERTAAATTTVAAAATYVGGTACITCHADAAKAWQGSHHDLAMQVAGASTVLGDFADATFSKDGVTSRFLLRDGQFWVNTDGADGKLADFRIAYTFGIEPLQQYLIEFPDGRLQALSIVWDTRAKAQGGQRWYHLHPDERVPAGDVLHWTGPAQNWNHMCAECHSTRFDKGFDAASDSFKSTWSDIDVNCESCHGPGSQHVAWAGKAEADRAGDARRGLAFRLNGTDDDAWRFTPDTSIAHRTRPLADRSELETCARCHSRRSQIRGDYRHGDPLAQTHRVALLDEGLYHADGQILDEVYEYGSFVQSAMHAAGVTCSDCHDPHSGRLRLDGDAVCTQCHRRTTYAVSAHHHHRNGGTGSRCVDCHMIERTYMGVDGRRDHGFRVPRPDLSVALGTPNACNDCHREADAAWAARWIAQWHGTGRAAEPHYAQALHAGRTAAPDAGPQLRALVADAAQPAIVRASGLELLARSATGADLALIASAASDPDPLVRRAAAGTLPTLPPSAALNFGARLLVDGVRTVRLEAVVSVLELPVEQLDPAARGGLDRALAEYRETQSLNGDRAEGHLNLGTLALRQGDSAAAEREFRIAIARQPQFVPAHLNLADALRALGREADAEAELRVALAITSENADLHHALGLALIRQRRYADAIASLERAASLRPGQPGYAYVLAIALHDTGKGPRALAVLADNAARHPGDVATLMALAQYSAEAGDREGALRWAERSAEVAPGDPQVAALIQSLRGN